MSRVVLITGASSGIGRATALACAERGDALVLVARRRPELEETAAACTRAGARSVMVSPCDVSCREDWETLFATAVVESGRIDVVVHAAAVAAYGRFADVPGDVFDQVLSINVSGTANVARNALQQFDRQGGGHLLLLGSLVGKISAPYLSPYVASKWAVHGLARTVQAERIGTPVHLSLVEPGGVSTGIYAKAASYLGVQGKPPPPVVSAEDVAAEVLRLIDRPHRERNVGLLNGFVSAGFQLLPAVYDRLVAPLMTRLALSDEPVADHTGNLFLHTGALRSEEER